MLSCVVLALGLCAGTVVAEEPQLPSSLGPGDFIPVDPAKAELGRLLFYDKILSGNRNISCGTCHHPRHGTSDGLSLGLGEGAEGLGPARLSGRGASRVQKRVPRNAPALWNLGAKSIRVLMHDGRISADPIYGNSFNTPAEEWLPGGLQSLLAAQALFPMTSSVEMAGNVGENEVIGATRDRIDLAWPIIAKRVRSLPDYGVGFVAAFDHIVTPENVEITDIAEALAQFMVQDFTSVDSPFDAYLAGNDTALTARQKAGADLFFGSAGCSGCHAGPLFSDQNFYALGLPAFGPGRARRFDPYARDVGRMGESDDLADAYRFRTPMLRNVELTGPYGHNGAFPTLERMIRHHLDPVASRSAWTPDDLQLPDVPWLAATDFVVQQDRFEMARQSRARDIYLRQNLSDQDIAALVAFLTALTGEKARAQQSSVPSAVPSGLPVDGAKR
ncbi:cytochrome-c peroxidase [Phaeobacter inhibens]|uniref:cytochrome-c peroxidase n=1 Tax=Phaeobacter inhibens TaxID=221822 RepID=UPI000C9B92FD|nr:cytochrome c peroxidase [Phaeobacter inhibens]AUQ53996.1 di-heme cytochrome c peroxidase-like protein [Phaeobacter inhibens]AUQ78012.1 di-heme cytochrome c peroxidase-like protein [Phaeobacter inhibens]AUR15171.1 di-heme cytochrome c peroxidase-like protein [Phaeobacter inhibens]UWR50387.1 cytochrome C peroxidase [Phaeobacter inhibens]